MRVYLSGAVSGVPELNYEQFQVAEEALRAKGYVVVNPLKLDHSKCKKYIDFMRKDVKAMKTCQRIYLLRGSQLSRGSRIELSIAKKHGIEVTREIV